MKSNDRYRQMRRSVRGVGPLGSARARVMAVAVALLLAAGGVDSGLAAEATSAPGRMTRLLVVTGGHDFETNQFFQMFKDMPAASFQTATHAQAHDWLKPEAARAYDVLVLYDMWQDITDEAKSNFVARLQEGKGLVILHHAIANYQKWPEYERVLGGRYYLQKTMVGGVEKARSIYQHGVHFRVRVLNSSHPVTVGVSDFEIHDETYNLYDVAPDAERLLGTDEPTSARVIGWAHAYAKARVVYLQGGHDHFAYENPAYRRLLANAVHWTAWGK